ncbi:LOW QUALITY PROTEIN: protein NUCLEAR FUSION DEFECTIVE 4-like [Phalaenopsis equestris]|uniref:LOW QUALITY PROTEIN: protein NUCLEAR FUSION DEFECTIVE 4-like n=1 Tax=Phalaenopsis equestris TaxID=78828 RepID=UPI0009E4E391|nr:LOW QUALITY PROTEIN: protein NUCLEAR FUSION DEFECTIVE 4-like [Phalaenopsis equestris]
MGALPWQSTEVGKWLGFVTAVWVQCISGNNYTFSNYSDALKTLMGLTQLELNNLSVAKDIGKAFGILAGLASDRLPTPVLLLIGSLEGLVGYGAQWLVVRQSIPPLPYWQMCVFLCMGGNSTTWMNTAVLVTCIRNFHRNRGHNRGPVSGILKGYVGLNCTAIFTDLCSALFTDDPASFILMLAVIPVVICAIAMIFLRQTPPPSTYTGDDTENRYFWWINTAAVLIAVYLLAFDLTGDHGVVVSRIFSAGLIVLLAAPAIVPAFLWFKARSSSLRAATSDLEVAESQIQAPLLTSSSTEEKNLPVEPAECGDRGKQVQKRLEIGEDHTIWEAMRKLEFWVLFVSFLCGVGTGMAVMNNMGQMGLSMGYSDVSIFVSLISIWGFFGRIASGSISEHFLNKSGTPRPLWNAASQILMAVGYIVMAVALPGSLYIGSIVVGICYGVRLAISVPTASELFGLKYYGLIYNVLILNLPLGSFLFSGLLAGLLYDAEATETPGGGNTCVGAHCYRLVFVIMTFACFVGFGLDVLLAIWTRGVYLKIHMNKKLNRSEIQ